MGIFRQLSEQGLGWPDGDGVFNSSSFNKLFRESLAVLSK